MKRVFRGIAAKLLLLVALAPLPLVFLFWRDWQHFCAGGRRGNPNFNIAECVDLQRVFHYLSSIWVLAFMPLLLFLLVRLLRDRRHRR